jgi:hypothetical protein
VLKYVSNFRKTDVDRLITVDSKKKKKSK